MESVRLVLDAGGVRSVAADGADLGSHEAFWSPDPRSIPTPRSAQRADRPASCTASSSRRGFGGHGRSIVARSSARGGVTPGARRCAPSRPRWSPAKPGICGAGK